MSRLPADRALRRIVADIAALHADDVAAILDDLDVPERKIIEDVLGEYAVSFEGIGKQRESADFGASQLSAWLAERVQARDRSEMTTQARQALRDCATRLFPAAPERRAS